jgi:hypothetical protein
MKKIITALIMLLLYQLINAQTINKLEYFIDTDKGVGKNKLVNVTAASDGTFPFVASLNSLLPGYHTLYIRARDNNGKWSLTTRQYIQVFSTDAKKIIIKGEYFFDTDDGFGKGKTINVVKPDSLVLQSFTASVTSLQPGYHQMYIRFLDNYGNWSETARYNVQVTKNADSAYIVKVEYFFINDAGVGKCSSIILSPALQNGEYLFVIPKNEIPANAKTLYLRVKDSAAGDWSLTRFKVVNNNAISTDTIVSAASVEKTSFSIMPNPAHDYLNVLLKGFNEKNNVNILIKDISGKVILTKRSRVFSNEKINVSALAKGTYFITVITDNYTSTQKFILQ